MEPLQLNTSCVFIKEPNQTFNIYYRTQNTQFYIVTQQSAFIKYRINGGPWISSSVVNSAQGPSTYVTVATFTVQKNDLVEYYFDLYGSVYGYGNGGPFSGGGGQSSTTVVVGVNSVYFNICTQIISDISSFCTYSIE